MTKPTIAGLRSARAEIVAGETYHWCSCGQSKTQPFCDGSHQGTDFKPVAFVAENTERAYLCACKQTRNPPYCDGSHKQLPGYVDPRS